MDDLGSLAFEISEECNLWGRYMKNGYPQGDEQVKIPAGKYVAVHLLPPVCLLVLYSEEADDLSSKHSWVVFIQHLLKEMLSRGVKIEIQA